VTGDQLAVISDPVAPQGGPVLVASGISKHFGGIAALTDVRFDLRPGEIHALMGENGAGKSTLMKILSGVYAQYDGEVLLDGRSLRFANVRQAEAEGIAIIHQELNLVPELTVADNIFLGREPRIAGLIIDRKAGRAAARDLLARLGIALDPDARVGGLRVGEQQLVEIAKALSISARILIMDEPTSALSPAECERLFKIVRQLASEGVAIVYISHRIDEVMHLADRVTVFRDGRHVLTRDMNDLSEERIIAAMVGRDLLAASGAEATGGGEAVLSVRDLTLAKPHRRGWRDVLRGVSFDLHAGEILGIGGLLGSGRTEILETVFGSATGRAGGSISLFGGPVDIRSPRDARRLGLALVTEDRKGQGLHLQASHGSASAPSPARRVWRGARSMRSAYAARMSSSLPARYRAAINRRSSSANGSRHGRGCCCSMSRHAASMSGRSARSTT
jgi:ribose transport system ATP-binding protein